MSTAPSAISAQDFSSSFLFFERQRTSNGGGFHRLVAGRCHTGETRIAERCMHFIPETMKRRLQVLNSRTFVGDLVMNRRTHLRVPFELQELFNGYDTTLNDPKIVREYQNSTYANSRF